MIDLDRADLHSLLGVGKLPIGEFLRRRLDPWGDDERLSAIAPDEMADADAAAVGLDVAIVPGQAER